MARRTTARERRLWLAAASVVVVTYATIPVAPRLARLLANEAVAGVAFVAGLLLLGATVVAIGGRTTPAGRDLGLALGALALTFLLIARTASLAERTHLIEYGLLGALLHAALTERAETLGTVRHPTALAICASGLLGVVDELVQAVVPSRVFDPVDIGFNLLASTTAIVAVAVVRRKVGAQA